MTDKQSKRIDAAAGIAMAEWESQFSLELLAHAKTLATRSNSGLVTLEHLRQAARPAVEKLLVAIKGEQETDGQRKAA
jgi:hypothetical protein